MSIHPTAVVDPGARLGKSVKVGPYSVIGAEVEIGDETQVGAHVVLEGPTRIGRRNRIFPFCTIGLIPQDLKFRGERSEVIIGDDNRIREFVTVHRGTEGGGALTKIGNDNLIMAYCHIAHDCILGDGIIMGNGATLAGHVVIEDKAGVGAFSGVHQFCRVGTHAYIGGYTVITKDVLPYSWTVHKREAKAFGANAEGLKRHGFSAAQIEKIDRALKLLSRSKLNTTQAVEALREQFSGEAEVDMLVEFVEKSERGVIK